MAELDVMMLSCFVNITIEIHDGTNKKSREAIISAVLISLLQNAHKSNYLWQR